MKKRNNKGFTLVELIVVLVILAILAAILTPMLLGYIDEAKNKDKELKAKALMSAIQAEMTKCYGKYNPDGTKDANNFIGEPIGKFSDSDDDPNLTDTIFRETVFEKAGITETPYLVMFYTKTYGTKENNKPFSSQLSGNISELRDAFTVLSVVYWEKEEDKPIFFNFDTDSWEEGSLYTAEIMVRGQTYNANKNKYKGYDKNMVLSGHKYDGTRVRIYVLYNGTKKTKITEINTLIEKKVGYTAS